jgi:hypothetical protein
VGSRPPLLALAAACLGLVLAAPGDCGSGEHRRAASSTPTETLVLQLLRPGEPLAVVALPDGRPRIVRGLALRGGDPPLRVLRTGGRLVYYGAGGIFAIDLALKGRPEKLGAGWYFIPSATDGRVWLTFADAHERDVRAVAELTVRGRVTARGGRPPCRGASVLAATAEALLCQDDASRLLAFDPKTGDVLRRLAGPFPLDTHGSLVAWCANRCPRLHVTDVGTGADTVVEPGPGFRFEESYEGAFSPGGSLLAAPVIAPGGRRVALVDVAAGTARVIAGARLSGYRNLTWSSSGRWLFFNARAGRIGAHDPASGRTRLLPFRLGSHVLDMAAS